MLMRKRAILTEALRVAFWRRGTARHTPQGHHHHHLASCHTSAAAVICGALFILVPSDSSFSRRWVLLAWLNDASYSLHTNLAELCLSTWRVDVIAYTFLLRRRDGDEAKNYRRFVFFWVSCSIKCTFPHILLYFFLLSETFLTIRFRKNSTGGGAG